MKKTVLVILALGFLAGIQAKTSINLKDYKIDARDATPAFQRAIADAKKENASEIVIPKGTYHFYPDQAFEKYCAVSNNSNGLKRILFPLIGFENIEINGNGSLFIFHGNMIPFQIENSKNLKIKNINIDWNRAFHSEGRVVATDAVNKTFDIAIQPEFGYEIQGNELIWVGEGWKQNIEKNLFFDPATKSTVYNVGIYKLDPWNPLLSTKYSAKEIKKGLVRITDTIATLPKVGWIWVSKGGKIPDRQSPAMHFYQTFNIQLENINIYHAGAMGIIAERSGDISLENVNVLLPPDGKRIVSTTADATHFVNCKGTISLSDCTFENMLDDATNVHGFYVTVSRLISPRTIGFNLKHMEQWGSEFAQPGDSLRFVNRQNLTPSKSYLVESVKYVNEQYSEVTFTEALDAAVDVNMSIENTSWQPKLSMKNCTVRQNRARSLLISTGGDVLIENNRFSSMMAGISIGGDANFWFESGPVRNVVIRNNTFTNCCTSGQNQACITIDPNILDQKNKTDYFESNIMIEGNKFNTFDRAILSAHSVDNLVFKNNVIEQTHDFTPLYPTRATIEASFCRGVVVSGNSYVGDKPATIVMDKSNVSDIHLKRNAGFTSK